MCRGFHWEPRGKETTWETQGVDGRIILRWIFRKFYVWGMDRIDLEEDMDRWRALVTAIMNLRVP